MGRRGRRRGLIKEREGRSPLFPLNIGLLSEFFSNPAASRPFGMPLPAGGCDAPVGLAFEGKREWQASGAATAQEVGQQGALVVSALRPRPRTSVAGARAREGRQLVTVAPPGSSCRAGQEGRVRTGRMKHARRTSKGPIDGSSAALALAQAPAAGRTTTTSLPEGALIPPIADALWLRAGPPPTTRRLRGECSRERPP